MVIVYAKRNIGINDPETGMGYIASMDFPIDTHNNNTPFYSDILHIGEFEAVVSYVNPKNNNRVYRIKREKNEEN